MKEHAPHHVQNGNHLLSRGVRWIYIDCISVSIEHNHLSFQLVSFVDLTFRLKFLPIQWTKIRGIRRVAIKLCIVAGHIDFFRGSAGYPIRVNSVKPDGSDNVLSQMCNS